MTLNSTSKIKQFIVIIQKKRKKHTYYNYILLDIYIQYPNIRHYSKKINTLANLAARIFVYEVDSLCKKARVCIQMGRGESERKSRRRHHSSCAYEKKREKASERKRPNASVYEMTFAPRR